MSPSTECAEVRHETAWSWVVALACFWLSFLTVGLHRSAGVIYVSVVQAYAVARENASWPFTLCGSIMCLLGPLAGFLTHFFSIRTILLCGVVVAGVGVTCSYFTTGVLYLVIFFGAIRGVGNGLVVTLNPVIINQYFQRRKATATGIAYAGASVGSFVLPPFVDYLLLTYGLKGSFLVLGGLVLNGLVAASLCRPPPVVKSEPSHNGTLTCEKNGNCVPTGDPVKDTASPTNHESLHPLLTSVPEQNGKVLPEDGMSSSLLEGEEVRVRGGAACHHLRAIGEVLASPVYVVICFTFGSNIVNFLSYLTVVVDFAIDHNVSEPDAVFLVSAFSVGDLFGALFLSWLSDLNYIRRKHSVVLCFLGTGVMLAVLPLCWTYQLMLTISIGIGLLNGCAMTNIPVMMREYLGLQRLAVAVGLGHFLVGIGQLLLPFMIGYFRDQVGTYDHLFHALSALCLTCSALWIAEGILNRTKKQPSWPGVTPSPIQCPVTHGD